jgi:maleylpyruvate isomerase
VPDLTLRPRDQNAIVIGAGGPEIAGPAADIAAWLAGRSDGSHLSSDRPLPELPAW